MEQNFFMLFRGRENESIVRSKNIKLGDFYMKDICEACVGKHIPYQKSL